MKNSLAVKSNKEVGYSTYACTGLFFCCRARVGSAGIKSLHHHLAVPIPGYVPTNHLSITSPSLTWKFVSTMMWMLVSSPFLPLCVPTPRTQPSTSTHHQQQRRPVVAATTAAAGRAQHHQHHGNRSPRRDGRVHKHRAQENKTSAGLSTFSRRVSSLRSYKYYARPSPSDYRNHRGHRTHPGPAFKARVFHDKRSRLSALKMVALERSRR